MLDLIVTGEDGINIPRRSLTKAITRTLQIAGCKEKKPLICLTLVSDRTIRKLNKGYRGKDKATDVLSFEVPKACKKANGFLGDIIISVASAKKNAKEQKVSLSQELIRLSVHGTLHLLGYDHEGNVPKKKAQHMFELQEQIVKKVIAELR